MSIAWMMGLEEGTPEEQKYKGVMSQGSVAPAGGPAGDTYEMFVGYFDFSDRRIAASMLFRTSGDPPRFGGWTPAENGDGDD